MGFDRTLFVTLALLAILPSLPGSLQAQAADRLWGRLRTTSGEVHQGFIRWDGSEGSWADVLDGSKEFVPFEFQDWWELAHPEDHHRDRVIELAGYRITWDDDEPDFPGSHESGIRFGHIRRLIPTDNQDVRLELRSGLVVELTGGGSNLGTDLSEVVVTDRGGIDSAFEWEELEWVEFSPAPADAGAATPRLFGTVEVRDGSAFTGHLTWGEDEIFTSDTLNAEDSEGRSREIPFGRIAGVRPVDDGAEITLTDGERVELFGTSDADPGSQGVQILDPALGLVDVDWDEVERVRFHESTGSFGPETFDGGRRLRGTVVTADSTELTGWIRWDGDEEYSWELLDGEDGDLTFDVEFGNIAAIERRLEMLVTVTVGARGAGVNPETVEGVRVTLRDGRVFELDGSNDVDDGNDGIFIVLDQSGDSPDDEDTRWVMVRWEDFRSVRFDWEGRP
jgi:hypothetical protein